MLVLMLFAFLAGVVTIVSPCVLPVLPLLLTTSVDGGKRRPLGIVLGLAATFSLVTLLVVAAADVLTVPVNTLRTVSIVLLIAFGVVMLVPALGHAFERWLAPLARIAGSRSLNGRTGFAGGLLIGAGLGFVWAPCVGPIMGSVIGLTASRGLTPEALAITFSYSLGGALPMLFIAYGARNLASRAKKLAPQSAKVRVAFGAVTVLAALAILFGYDTKLQDLATRALPGYSSALTSVEQGNAVTTELNKLNAAPQPVQGSAAQQPEAPVAVAPAVAVVQPTATKPRPAPTATPKPRPTATPVPAAPRVIMQLGDQGLAPELAGITGWFNTPNNQPLTIKGLRGKVVLIDFWTFECYNCRNTRPYVRALYDKYHSQGLEIIGVHTPEFAAERVPENIKNAAAEQNVNWPIAMDPDFKTWSAFHNQYWPALYFIDAKGHLRTAYFGEGNYDNKDKAVQQLLLEAHSR